PMFSLGMPGPSSANEAPIEYKHSINPELKIIK
ncbi:unnamed protein product, partial [marine sediment metagenome]